MPAPVRADTASMGAPCRNEPATSSWISSRATSMVAASVTSDFVITTSPAGTCSRRQISKCSRVCGITDSSAATCSMTRSIPPTPASMLRTNRSCPGTSTNESATPASIVCAKPRSIVMPRAFSSWRRSGSIPVKRQHQRALAVIDVAGGADDDVLHVPPLSKGLARLPLRPPEYAEMLPGRKRTGPGGPPGLQNRRAPRIAGRLGSTPRRFRQPAPFKLSGRRESAGIRSPPVGWGQGAVRVEPVRCTSCRLPTA